MPPFPDASLADSLAGIRKAMKNAAFSPLAAAKPCLMAASKQQSPEAIEEAIALGIADFGENRVQEAMAKWPPLKLKYPHVRLHLIGALQTNKVRECVRLFDSVQTLDRRELADALRRAMQSEGRSLPCLIQVNTGEEPQKAGVLPSGVGGLLAYCQSIGLTVTGLMCLPPLNQPPAPHFALLRKLALEHGLTELSMGMSDDFEEALRLGATCIRIGRSLFGERH